MPQSEPPRRPGQEPLPEGQPAGRPAPPPALRALVAGLGLEAAVLAVAAALVAVEAFAGGSGSIPMSVFLVLSALGVAWALLAAGRALLAGRRGGRSVVMTWQVFQVIVAFSALTSGAGWAVALGVGLLVVGLGVAVLLFTRPVVEATTWG
ncbi:hypothetical protein DNL40_05280 [Xylanimonas oleitrophica]|uniref:Integral membrane protein n=1 Tax=Xylanimonas oleitrophica TaxID=2607479 RepID=A0A2W5X0S8_9MICO|nr:hypothetical protein [Xylanimonas oleitrophica]PZR54316.1 hypothetical protein DNL40_05280 [Xylanimonas oleitrophica]